MLPALYIYIPTPVTTNNFWWACSTYYISWTIGAGPVGQVLKPERKLKPTNRGTIDWKTES